MTPARPYQALAAQLVDRIAQGGYRPGDRFPTERQIAAELGVSRSLVREAFIMLEIEGYLDVRKGSGSYVRDRSAARPTVTHSDFGPFELLQARQLLESTIAGFAATTVTKSDIRGLRDTLDLEQRSIDNGQDDTDADRQFHLRIAEATQNSVLVNQMAQLWHMRVANSMWDRLHSRIFDLSYRGKWLDDHAAILDALRFRDEARARQAMWQHLENVRLTLMELSDVEDPDFDGYLYARPQAG